MINSHALCQLSYGGRKYVVADVPTTFWNHVKLTMLIPQIEFHYKFRCASVFLDLAGFAPATLKGLTPMLWSVIFSHRRVPLA